MKTTPEKASKAALKISLLLDDTVEFEERFSCPDLERPGASSVSLYKLDRCTGASLRCRFVF